MPRQDPLLRDPFQNEPSSLLVVVSNFFLSDDGRWLTTGEETWIRAVDHHHAQSIAKQLGGVGRLVRATGRAFEGETTMHRTMLHWRRGAVVPQMKPGNWR